MCLIHQGGHQTGGAVMPHRLRLHSIYISPLASVHVSTVNHKSKYGMAQLSPLLRESSRGQNQGVGSAVFSLEALGKTPLPAPLGCWLKSVAGSARAKLLLWVLVAGQESLSAPEGLLHPSVCHLFHLHTSNSGVQPSSYFKCLFHASTASPSAVSVFWVQAEKILHVF